MINKQKIIWWSFLFFIALLVSGCTIRIGGSKTPDGGVWRSPDGGKTWQQIVAVPTVGTATTIANLNVRRMVFDPQDYQTIYLATENNGLVYTYDGGATWRQFRELNKGKIRSVAVDPKAKCILYAVMDNKLYKSNDCGRFWQNIYFHQNPQVIITDIVVDHYDSSVIYMVNSEGEVLKSRDGGQSWTNVYRVNRGVFMDLVMDQRDSRVVYAATQRHGIFKTTDGGNNWISLEDGLKPYSGSLEYVKLVSDQATAGSLILVSKYGLLRSRDGGINWEEVPLLPAPKKATIYSLAIDPNNSGEIYYTTMTTLVKSIDGGQTWSSRRLPFSRVANAILINPENSNLVYFGTFKIND